MSVERCCCCKNATTLHPPVPPYTSSHFLWSLWTLTTSCLSKTPSSEPCAPLTRPTKTQPGRRGTCTGNQCLVVAEVALSLAELACRGPGWSSVTLQLGLIGNGVGRGEAALMYHVPTGPLPGITVCTKAHLQLYLLIVCVGI